MKVLQKSEAIDRFRNDMFDASDKINGTVSLYDAMRLFNNYLEEIRAEWMVHKDGRWLYMKCSKCNSIHDVASMYCPSCGRLMGRADE